ncbi:hypothetical protein [Egicoccus sp. AB-alg6-2]|uniref:hypothetical protein n=1 Tax=Egicoccus sp. AB-alg6-2 TaxID=3242692 RepID=UPI00359D6AFC
MESCRCEVLNVLSGRVAQDYLRGHLAAGRTDGLGRQVHRCPVTELEWVADRSPGGYADDVLVLRRVLR